MSNTETIRRSVVLKQRPDGSPRREDFDIREDAIPAPGAGEVVTRTIWLSIDPYMRGRLREQQTYAQPVNPGEVMTGETVGEVVASADPRFVPGDVVVGARGWQTHTATPGDRLTKLDRHGAPLSAYLGVLGMPGATAYRGITEICRPKKGETVAISAASGAVGSVAGQLAKRAGARVVGVAGGAEKCLWVQDSLGFDDCVDHRALDLRAELRCRRRFSTCSTHSRGWRCAAWSRNITRPSSRPAPISALSSASA
jgi:NADPH-dependent curcumin reductase CurA